MTERKTVSDRPDQSDRIDLVGIIRSRSGRRLSDQSDQTAIKAHRGPSGPTGLKLGRTGKSVVNQIGPTGPIGPTDRIGTQPDADGVARTDAAIDAVWDAALERAVRYRQENTPPTCAACGKSDWLVSLIEINGTKFHIRCWKSRRAQNDFT